MNRNSLLGRSPIFGRVVVWPESSASGPAGPAAIPNVPIRKRKNPNHESTKVRKQEKTEIVSYFYMPVLYFQEKSVHVR